MAGKAGSKSKGSHFAPLQEWTLVEITDPVEQATLERMLDRAPLADGSAPAFKPTVAKLASLSRQLSASARIDLLARVAAELSAEDHRRLLERLSANPPAQAAPSAKPSRRRPPSC